MKWCLLVVLLVGASGAAAASTCSVTEDYFRSLNVSADDGDGTGPHCGGTCCGRRRENELRAAVRRKLVSRAASSLRPIEDLLLTTRTTLQEHLTALSHQSQNKTTLLFVRVYRDRASHAHPSISSLYEDIRTLLRNTGELGSPPSKDLAYTTKKFFRNIFPVAYHNILKMDSKQFSPEYELCLKDAYDAVQPFGDVPQELGTMLSRSMEAARSLLQALALGAGAAAAAEETLRESDSEHCVTAVLKAVACARCKGLDVRPCRSYCLNVVRGCVGAPLAELDGPWSGYVEGVERLARGDVDVALRTLDSRVSEAIMHALENHLTLEKKDSADKPDNLTISYDQMPLVRYFKSLMVRQECGPPTMINAPTSSSHTAEHSSRRNSLRAPPPDTELLQFAASLAATKRLFSGLSDKICDDPDIAEGRDNNCWTGESVGEYTKPLVSSSSISDQRYNPEVSTAAVANTRITSLADRLLHARQLLISHTWSGEPPSAEPFMLGDEANEGSGSGRSYPDDDAAYDAEGSGEGSGNDKIESRIYPGEEASNPVTPKTGAATVSTPMIKVIISMTLLSIITRSLT